MTAVVQADIDEQTVKEAEEVLRPPFETFEPNGTTIEAMGAARRGEVVTVGDIEDLFADLHADD